MNLERLKEMTKEVYPISVLMRHEIFENHVSSAALKRYLNINSYVAATLIYCLEADGYVSKPLAKYDYKRCLLK
jgi:hypothetical protein